MSEFRNKDVELSYDDTKLPPWSVLLRVDVEAIPRYYDYLGVDGRKVMVAMCAQLITYDGLDGRAADDCIHYTNFFKEVCSESSESEYKRMLCFARAFLEYRDFRQGGLKNPFAESDLSMSLTWDLRPEESESCEEVSTSSAEVANVAASDHQDVDGKEADKRPLPGFVSGGMLHSRYVCIQCGDLRKVSNNTPLLKATHYGMAVLCQTEECMARESYRECSYYVKDDEITLTWVKKVAQKRYKSGFSMPQYLVSSEMSVEEAEAYQHMSDEESTQVEEGFAVKWSRWGKNVDDFFSNAKAKMDDLARDQSETWEGVKQDIAESDAAKKCEEIQAYMMSGVLTAWHEGNMKAVELFLDGCKAWIEANPGQFTLYLIAIITAIGAIVGAAVMYQLSLIHI